MCVIETAGNRDIFQSPHLLQLLFRKARSRTFPPRVYGFVFLEWLQVYVTIFHEFL